VKRSSTKKDEKQEQEARGQEGSRTHGRSRKPITLINKLISTAQKNMQAGDVKLTITELIRLLQLQMELKEEETPRAIEVKWVQPTEERSSTET
jgi:hypothetical protein